MLSPEHARNDPLTTYRGPPASDRFRLFGRQCREYAGLLRVAEGLTFEPHRIDYDRTGRYNPLTNTEFPFCIRLFNYRHNDFTAALTWHEHLELWIPIDSEVSFRMAERRVDLDAGEILIVDNLKLHTVLDQPGLDARVISIGFLPEFVYSLGSPSYDYYALLPFFTRQTGSPHLVQRDAPLYPTMASTVADLLECYFARDFDRRFKAAFGQTPNEIRRSTKTREPARSNQVSVDKIE